MESIKSVKNKRILISALNWGMGHVSRCIGIVHLLNKKNNTVIIAGDTNQIRVFKEYFPNSIFIQHEGYPFVFNGKGNFSADLLRNSKPLFERFKNEKKEVAAYVEDYNIDLILSDHRYGFIHETVPSVFITHQLNLPVKWYQKSIQKLHEKLIASFYSIWILDDDNCSLAGNLSKNINGMNVQYIGPFSRFMMYDISRYAKKNTVYIASGPIIYAQDFVDSFCNNLSLDDVVIAPKEVKVKNRVGNLSWKGKDERILSAKKIVSRSGYSTIMDVLFLNCEGEFHPTKGQSEQLYLAELHKKSPTK